jgi:hypothetical protein
VYYACDIYNKGHYFRKQGLAFAASPTSTEELSTFIKQVEEPPALKMFGHDPTASLVRITVEHVQPDFTML